MRDDVGGVAHVSALAAHVPAVTALLHAVVKCRVLRTRYFWARAKTSSLQSGINNVFLVVFVVFMSVDRILTKIFTNI